MLGDRVLLLGLGRVVPSPIGTIPLDLSGRLIFVITYVSRLFISDTLFLAFLGPLVSGAYEISICFSWDNSCRNPSTIQNLLSS